MDKVAEIIIILGLVGLAAYSMYLGEDYSNDIMIAVTSGLLGYIAKGEYTGGRYGKQTK